VLRAHTVKGLRKQYRRQPAILSYRYSHYILRLREGRPPEHYYPRRMTGHEKMADYLNQLRERKVYHSL
jgi:large subunit ribosomal protein L22